MMRWDGTHTALALTEARMSDEFEEHYPRAERVCDSVVGKRAHIEFLHDNLIFNEHRDWNSKTFRWFVPEAKRREFKLIVKLLRVIAHQFVAPYEMVERMWEDRELGMRWGEGGVGLVVEYVGPLEGHEWAAALRAAGRLLNDDYFAAKAIPGRGRRPTIG